MLVTRDGLFQFIETNYEKKPQYLWDKFPEYAVFRHKDEGKWFGLVMNVPPWKVRFRRRRRTRCFKC